MIAIVDCGATKSEWVFIQESKVCHRISELGFNPNNQFSWDLSSALKDQLRVVKVLYLYVAGVVGDIQRDKVLKLISGVVDTQTKINIYSDLKAAARASYHSDAGLIGILGTGSVAAYYNGKSIVKISQGLGYAISDEGSGIDLGRELLRRFYYNMLPVAATNKLRNKINKRREELLPQLYEGNTAKEISTYSYHLYEYRQETWCQAILASCFNRFMEYRVIPLIENDHRQIRFVGSVASLYADELVDSAKAFQIEITGIIKHPIDKLIEYHCRYESE